MSPNAPWQTLTCERMLEREGYPLPLRGGIKKVHLGDGGYVTGHDHHGVWTVCTAKLILEEFQ